ncbi:MAG: c-type cytochrome [Myxococcaceae bacterium]|nr:c-type cytochrome [Myxococcaceae bacterium]
MVRLLAFSMLCLSCAAPKEAERPAAPVAAPAPVAPPDAGPPAPPPLPKLGAVLALPLQPAHPAPVEAVAAATAEKAELGYRLFFDPRLSKDGSMACAACHPPSKGWASSEKLDAKVGGALNVRNTPSVVGLAAHSTFYWDGRKPTLASVCEAAWKGQLGADPATVAAALNQDGVTRAFFQRAFQSDATAANVPEALAAFLLTLNSGNAPFDHFEAGDKAAISAEAKKGWELFKSKGCVTCHVPPLFTDLGFHQALAPGKDEGRKDATKDEADLGKFKTPSLRMAALTPPYFHDGSAATLTEAVEMMAAAKGKDEKLKAQKLSPKDVKAIVAFLESLTGQATYTEAPPPVQFAE